MAIFSPPSAPPTPNPMNLFAALVLFEFFVRGGEGGRRGMEWLSCHVPLNILTFCTEKEKCKKLVYLESKILGKVAKENP